MEALRTSETSVYSNEATGRYIAEDSKLHTMRIFGSYAARSSKQRSGRAKQNRPCKPVAEPPYILSVYLALGLFSVS